MKEIKRLTDKASIISILEDKSSSLIERIKSAPSSTFIMYYKYISHSDLPTYGKATRVNRLNDNLLYYLSVNEMVEIETRMDKDFETAHQSNIGVPSDFWSDIGMRSPREVVQDPRYDKRINKYANVFVVNENLHYFTSKYTFLVFSKLRKSIDHRRLSEWTSSQMDITTSSGEFTEVKLTQAVHGLSTSDDIEFRKLRHNIFKNDLLILLVEKSIDVCNIFILPYKNPTFYTLIGETNTVWEKYQKRELEKIERASLFDIEIKDQLVTRQYQDKWRTKLAEEIMNYTVNDREVFCPLTYISADFDSLGTLFRASHIKSYSESSDEEKFDINNGILMVANADALFDKHLITIGEDKELIFSFLIEQNALLKNKLMLSNPIFKDILNDKRMEYIRVHRKVFMEKEKERKTGE